METEIEQEVCDAKWNRTGFGVRGSEWGSGTGNMKQANIGNMKCMGEQNQEWGYERISRNDKAGVIGRTEPGWETEGGCVPDPKLGWSSEGDLGRSTDPSVITESTSTLLFAQGIKKVHVSTSSLHLYMYLDC